MVLKIATRGSSTGTLPKVATGILGFDASTGGGLPAARPSLVRGAAGLWQTPFDEPGVFMSSGKRAENLATNIASLGPDLDGPAASGKLAIDHLRVERSEIEGTGDDDLEGLFVRLGCAMGVVLDAIATLVLRFRQPGPGYAAKCCGSFHGTNECPFLIDEEGISVVPVTSSRLDRPAPTSRDRGSSILLSGVAGTGTGQTTFGLHFIIAAG